MFNLAVVRNSQLIQINSEELLVGDIVKLENGMILPSDGLLLEGESVQIDESSITGESIPVKKDSHAKCISKKLSYTGYKEGKSIPSPVLISGTQVENGHGWFVAIAVGKNSVSGKIFDLVMNSSEESNE